MFCGGPEPLHELGVIRPFVVRPEEHQEEWCRVDAPVVQPERDLARRRHLARARLVEDLARFRVLLGINDARLPVCQVRQDPFGDRGIHPERLQCGNQPVATKRGAKPRYPSVGIGARVLRRQHQIQVGGGLIDPRIELLIAAVDDARAHLRLPLASRGPGQFVGVATRGDRLCSHLAARRQFQREALLRVEVHGPGGRRSRNLGRLR